MINASEQLCIYWINVFSVPFRWKVKVRWCEFSRDRLPQPAAGLAAECGAGDCKWVTSHADTPGPGINRTLSSKLSRAHFLENSIKNTQRQANVRIISDIKNKVKTDHYCLWDHFPSWLARYCPSLVTVHAGGGRYANIYATFMWKICKLGCQYLQFFPATFNTANKQEAPFLRIQNQSRTDFTKVHGVSDNSLWVTHISGILLNHVTTFRIEHWTKKGVWAELKRYPDLYH